jgi:hypothetical protein
MYNIMYLYIYILFLVSEKAIYGPLNLIALIHDINLQFCSVCPLLRFVLIAPCSRHLHLHLLEETVIDRATLILRRLLGLHVGVVSWRTLPFFVVCFLRLG